MQTSWLMHKQVAESTPEKPAPPSQCALQLQWVLSNLLEPFTSTWPSFNHSKKRGGTK
jgi:hypothetical protein